MKLTYDPKYNIAYISFRDKSEQVETIQISEEMNVDIAPDGAIYGIELLNASQQLDPDQNGSLVVTNLSSGESATIKLTV